MLATLDGRMMLPCRADATAALLLVLIAVWLWIRNCSPPQQSEKSATSISSQQPSASQKSKVATEEFCWFACCTARKSPSENIRDHHARQMEEEAKTKTMSQNEDRALVCTKEQMLLTIVSDVQACCGGSADWVTSADAERMLVATEGEEQLARKKLVQAAKWRQDTLLVWHDEVNAKAATLPSDCRQIAFTAAGHPLMYHSAVHQQAGETVAANFAVAMDNAIRAAGPRAKIDFIIDSTGFQLLLNLRVRPWLNLGSTLDSYFAERFNSIWVIDFPVVGRFLMNAMLELTPPKTKQKMHVITRRNAEEMRVMFDALCDGDEMRRMLSQLLEMNEKATAETGRAASHELTNEFLRLQMRRR